MLLELANGIAAELNVFKACSMLAATTCVGMQLLSWHFAEARTSCRPKLA